SSIAFRPGEGTDTEFDSEAVTDVYEPHRGSDETPAAILQFAPQPLSTEEGSPKSSVPSLGTDPLLPLPLQTEPATPSFGTSRYSRVLRLFVAGLYEQTPRTIRPTLLGWFLVFLLAGGSFVFLLHRKTTIFEGQEPSDGNPPPSSLQSGKTDKASKSSIPPPEIRSLPEVRAIPETPDDEIDGGSLDGADAQLDVEIDTSGPDSGLESPPPSKKKKRSKKAKITQRKLQRKK
ncbi:MAG: hypothetical protein V1754_06595, partial [Pseudomonadota bacterium]